MAEPGDYERGKDMSEVAKITVDSKIINRIARLASIDQQMGLKSQVYILIYRGRLMLAAFDGTCLGMREVEFEPKDMTGEEAMNASDENNRAIYEIDNKTWMFPADLKIPNGLNVTISIYDSFEVALRTKNACYGPFDKVKTLEGTEAIFDIHAIISYPQESKGSCRVLNPAKTVKLIAAIADKDDCIIFNVSGTPKDKMHIKTINNKGFGMVMPIKNEGYFKELELDNSKEEIDEDMD